MEAAAGVSSAREVRLSLVRGLPREDKLPVSQQGVVPKGDVGKPAFDLGMKRWGKWHRKGEQRDSRQENLKRERKIQAGRDKRKGLSAGPSN